MQLPFPNLQNWESTVSQRSSDALMLPASERYSRTLDFFLDKVRRSEFQPNRYLNVKKR